MEIRYRACGPESHTSRSEVIEALKIAFEPRVVVDQLQHAAELEIIDLDVLGQILREIQGLRLGQRLHFVRDVEQEVARLLDPSSRW
jgi:hypothetical protein